MAKIFLTTDSHFGLSPLDLMKWLKIQKQYYYDQFIPDLLSKFEEGDILVHMGDLLDNRDELEILIKHEVDALINTLRQILPVYIIVGNHDMYNKSTKNNIINTIQHLQWLPNVTIINKTTTINFDGQDIVMMPFFDKKNDMIEEISNNRGDILLCHSDLNGIRMNVTSASYKKTNMIDVESFTAYKKVYTGHIHIRQTLGNVEFIGSPYMMDRNDYGNEKGMTILYPSELRTEFIPNRVSPIFEKISIKKEDDLIYLENYNKHNFVDLEIYNSVLVSSKKVRRKIESILETGKFAKVDYINDIIKNDLVDDMKTNVINEKLANIDVEQGGITNNLDDVIKLYMDYIEFDSEGNKIGVLNEFEVVKEKYDIIHAKNMNIN